MKLTSVTTPKKSFISVFENEHISLSVFFGVVGALVLLVIIMLTIFVALRERVKKRRQREETRSVSTTDASMDDTSSQSSQPASLGSDTPLTRSPAIRRQSDDYIDCFDDPISFVIPRARAMAMPEFSRSNAYIGCIGQPTSTLSVKPRRERNKGKGIFNFLGRKRNKNKAKNDRFHVSGEPSFWIDIPSELM